MILDSSAILSIVYREPEYDVLVAKILNAPLAGIGTPTLVETGIVLTARLGPFARGIVERFLDEFQVVEVPFGERHWRTAVDAFERFGRGRHPAGLNFGDCLAYASASVADEELLYVGDDFQHTDVRVA
ncbi:MAG TPA: type II toxin-antitoxin system VapC family toxin [Gemmatimonadota bacterium]|nr:type II toxin-antitoxin system VapC family toxin [Gemmatimonadota bacterium]